MKADMVLSLLESHYARDERRFDVLVQQAIAQAAAGGQRKFERDLRSAHAKAKKTPEFITLTGPVADLMDQVRPTSLSTLQLEPAAKETLARVVKEQRAAPKLRSHGLSPARRLLLTGPPGTGKTSTGAALAGEMGIPCFCVRLDGLIKSHLGETASNLRKVFDQIASQRAVYLLDEFDALGASRGRENETGEMRRVVNSLLQFMEQDSAFDSVIVSATNDAKSLDRALFRRFDAVIEYSLPGEMVRANLLEALFIALHVELELLTQGRCVELVDSSKGLSHADITNAVRTCAKKAILDDRSISVVEIKTCLESMVRTGGFQGE